MQNPSGNCVLLNETSKYPAHNLKLLKSTVFFILGEIYSIVIWIEENNKCLYQSKVRMLIGKVNIFRVGGCIPHEVEVDKTNVRGPFGLAFPTGQDFLVPRDKGTDML